MKARRLTPALPMKPDKRPIECGRSLSASHRNRPPSCPTTGIGRKGSKRGPTPTAPEPGPPPPCGVEKVLQIHVNDVESHVTRAHLAEDRVQIGAVIVEQAA